MRAARHNAGPWKPSLNVAQIRALAELYDAPVDVEDEEDDGGESAAVAFDWLSEHHPELIEIPRPWDEEGAMMDFMDASGEEDLDFDDIEESEFWDVDVFEVSSGSREWIIFRDDGDATEAAEAEIRDRLQRSPTTYFTAQRLEEYIDQDKLKQHVLEVMLADDDYARDMDPERFWEEAEAQDGFDEEIPEPDEDDEMPEPSESDIEEFTRARAEEMAKDPMAWFEDYYYGPEAIEKAIEVVGIDINAAAEGIVAEDGWIHWVNSYDDNYYETPSGFVYFRVN